MGCNCKATEIVLSLVVIVFTLWQIAYSNWIVVIAAVLLLIHTLKCNARCAMPASAPAPEAKKKK